MGVLRLASTLGVNWSASEEDRAKRASFQECTKLCEEIRKRDEQLRASVTLGKNDRSGVRMIVFETYVRFRVTNKRSWFKL